MTMFSSLQHRVECSLAMRGSRTESHCAYRSREENTESLDEGLSWEPGNCIHTHGENGAPRSVFPLSMISTLTKSRYGADFPGVYVFGQKTYQYRTEHGSGDVWNIKT